jgi:glyoxylase-like metal-dependent hydrolase (beta-lactamase superfamily II)
MAITSAAMPGSRPRPAAKVIAPAAEAAKIPTLDVAVGEGDTVLDRQGCGTVMEVPAHTAGHIAYHLPEAGIAFVGDTLFAMGCGRLFEGTAGADVAQHAAARSAAPRDQVYCAHEYTQSNGRYALVAEPDNAAIAERMRAGRCRPRRAARRPCRPRSRWNAPPIPSCARAMPMNSDDAVPRRMRFAVEPKVQDGKGAGPCAY